MTHKDIIQYITTSNKYKSFCYSFTSGSHLWEDLYQEAMLQVCEPSMKDKLLKADCIDSYVTGIIKIIWLNRGKVKLFKQSTSNLNLMSDKMRIITDDYNINQDHRDLVKEAVNELDKKMRSRIEEDRLAAKLLWDVCKSNTNTVSKKNGTSNYQVKRRITPILKDLKRKLE